MAEKKEKADKRPKTVKDAEEKAGKARKDDLEKLIVEEAHALTEGKSQDLQLLMALCKRAKSGK